MIIGIGSIMFCMIMRLHFRFNILFQRSNKIVAIHRAENQLYYPRQEALVKPCVLHKNIEY